jgi:hypothetical protein
MSTDKITIFQRLTRLSRPFLPVKSDRHSTDKATADWKTQRSATVHMCTVYYFRIP